MPPPMYPAPTMVTVEMVEMVIRGNSFVRGRLSDEGAGAATPDAAFVKAFRGLVTAILAILLDIDQGWSCDVILPQNRGPRHLMGALPLPVAQVSACACRRRR